MEGLEWNFQGGGVASLGSGSPISRNTRIAEAKGQTKVRIPPHTSHKRTSLYIDTTVVELYGALWSLNHSQYLELFCHPRPICNLTYKSNFTMADSWSRKEFRSWDTMGWSRCNSGMGIEVLSYTIGKESPSMVQWPHEFRVRSGKKAILREESFFIVLFYQWWQSDHQHLSVVLGLWFSTWNTRELDSTSSSQ